MCVCVCVWSDSIGIQRWMLRFPFFHPLIMRAVLSSFPRNFSPVRWGGLYWVFPWRILGWILLNPLPPAYSCVLYFVSFLVKSWSGVVHSRPECSQVKSMLRCIFWEKSTESPNGDNDYQWWYTTPTLINVIKLHHLVQWRIDEYLFSKHSMDHHWVRTMDVYCDHTLEGYHYPCQLTNIK